SVVTERDRVRVTVQLVNSVNGAHLWSHTLDRAFSGIIALREEMARAIVERLKQQTANADEARLALAHTRGEVYEQYLQALFSHDRATRNGLERSLVHFQKV